MVKLGGTILMKSFILKLLEIDKKNISQRDPLFEWLFTLRGALVLIPLYSLIPYFFIDYLYLFHVDKRIMVTATYFSFGAMYLLMFGVRLLYNVSLAFRLRR
jgi:hypothetical protein